MPYFMEERIEAQRGFSNFLMATQQLLILAEHFMGIKFF